MALTKMQKEDIVKKYARTEGDTGSPEVQIAILTQEINELTEHLKEHTHEEDYLKKLVEEEVYLTTYLKMMLLVIEQ